MGDTGRPASFLAHGSSSARGEAAQRSEELNRMRSSGLGIAATIALGSAACMVGTGALAAEEPPAGTEALESIVDVRSKGNEEAAKVQKQIDGIADETDELLSHYRTVLKQIDSMDIYNRQMLGLTQEQEAELASLEDQLGSVQEVGRSVTPLMLRMVDAIEEFVRLDVPFLEKERTERIAALRKMMGRADITNAEKFRQIMEAYQIENEYGRTIEAYRGTLMLGDKETTVDFLRFGRIALVYQSLDETETGMWDQKARVWVPLDSSYRSGVREGLRIARKQTAPDLVRLPLPAPAEGGEIN